MLSMRPLKYCDLDLSTLQLFAALPTQILFFSLSNGPVSVWRQWPRQSDAKCLIKLKKHRWSETNKTATILALWDRIDDPQVGLNSHSTHKVTLTTCNFHQILRHQGIRKSEKCSCPFSRKYKETHPQYIPSKDFKGTVREAGLPLETGNVLLLPRMRNE